LAYKVAAKTDPSNMEYRLLIAKQPKTWNMQA